MRSPAPRSRPAIRTTCLRIRRTRGCASFSLAVSKEATQQAVMSKRVSPTVIGAFVVASFAILVVALIVVGSGRIFTKPIRFICMFQGNLNGLKVGAPVKVRGVQIGTVASIELRLLPSQGQISPGIKGLRLPVIIDGDRSQVLARGASGEALETSGFDDWIKRGMRAQLATES